MVSADLRICRLMLAATLAVAAFFFVVPLILIVGYSLQGSETALQGYAELVRSNLFRKVLYETILISVLVTALCAALGYPVAWYIAQKSGSMRTMLLALVLIPFWSSILVKSYSFTQLLGTNSFATVLVQYLTGASAPVELLFTRFSVVIGLTNWCLPFMILPIVSNLLSQDPRLSLVARVMGATPWQSFRSVTLPLSLPGLRMGVLMAFVLCLGAYITPALLGGRGNILLGNLIDFYTKQSLEWNVASRIAVVLLVMTGSVAFFLLRSRQSEKLS